MVVTLSMPTEKKEDLKIPHNFLGDFVCKLSNACAAEFLHHPGFRVNSIANETVSVMIPVWQRF